MTEEDRHNAYVEQRKRREAFQAALNVAMTPESDAPAEAIRTDWQPMIDFIREGPDIGHTDDADQPDDVPRFN